MFVDYDGACEVERDLHSQVPEGYTFAWTDDDINGGVLVAVACCSFTL